jgi:hypothetical protein
VTGVMPAPPSGVDIRGGDRHRPAPEAMAPGHG